MANYGQIFSTNDIARQLKEANRTYEGLKIWEQLYGSVNLAEQQAISSLEQDYSREVGQAYLSSLRQEQDILASNIGQGYKEQMLDENQLALEEAFESYQQSYLQGVQTIKETFAEQTQNVTSQLETQASNIEGLTTSVYDYLKYVYETNPNLLETLGWQEYLNYTPKLDGEGNQIKDDEGNIIYNKTLKSWGELTTAGLDDNNEYTSLVDEQGYLTIKGIDFYDKIMNQINTDQYGVSSWQNWLKETNPELYDWSQSYNPYNYAAYIDPNTGEIKNTNIGSFRTLVGLTSGDQTYSFKERFGGLTEKELNAKFVDFQNDFANINSKDPEKYVESLNSVTEDIKKLSQTLGIENEIEEAIGDWNNLTTILNQYVTDAQNKESELRKEHMIQTAKIAAGTAGVSTAVSFIPFIGPFAAGLTIAAGVGVEAGVSASYQEAIDYEKAKAIQNAKNAYADMILAFTNYAQEVRRQKQNKNNNK